MFPPFCIARLEKLLERLVSFLVDVKLESLLFVGAAVLLLGGSGLALPYATAGPPPALFKGSSSHSLSYFYTAVSEPGQGLPQFVTLGYVDDQLFVQYDSNTKKALPQVPWMEKADEEDPQYWDRQTQGLQGTEPVFRERMATLRNRYNQSGGFHSMQLMYGCELRGDGSKGGHYQFAYEGRDYLSLEKETLTWTAADTQAQISKRKWEAEPAIAQNLKGYLEGTCIEWLQRYLGYSKEALLRKEPPTVKMTRTATSDSLETLVCQAHGFYPREIYATWMRDGEMLEYETFRRNIAPNPDRTYHIWLSIEIDPKERDRYRCHVDHAGLPQPLVLAWEESGANVWLIVGAFIGAILVLLVAAGIFIIIKKQVSMFHKPRLQNHQESNHSSRSSTLASEGSDKQNDPVSNRSSSSGSLESGDSDKPLLRVR